LRPQIVDDIEFGGLDVGANGKAQVDKALPATNEGTDIGQPRRVHEHIFLRLDNVGFHFLGRRRTPEVGNRNLRFFDIRQQLDRQRRDRAQAEKRDQRDSYGY
jgi:hypothetical protein